MKSDLPPGGLLPLHHEAAVEPVNSNQLVMGVLLNDLTVIDNKNLVGMAHSFQPVSNHDDRLIEGQFCNGLHQLLFIFGVNIRGASELTACGFQKRSEFSAVCGIIVVKRKITAELAVIFLKMVDLIGIEPTTLRMRTVRSPS